MQLPLSRVVASLWGKRAWAVAKEYRDAFQGRDLLLADLAMRCNVAAVEPANDPIALARAEGRREVFLHIARMSKLQPSDFVSIADGERL